HIQSTFQSPHNILSNLSYTSLTSNLPSINPTSSIPLNHTFPNIFNINPNKSLQPSFNPSHTLINTLSSNIFTPNKSPTNTLNPQSLQQLSK
ncbi:hypothetical protein, partial [Siminovitchia fortis]|uniref:hypothetical protein n=1 Tax=Siminovitchia fortis TaxID=254758 RepID=UPI001C92E98B